MPLRVAVMGCVVNGPRREADLGVASGNGKGQIFVRGEVIKTVKEADIVETLIDEAMRLAGIHARRRRRARGQRALDMRKVAGTIASRWARDGSVRVLNRSDLPAAIRLLSANPIENVFVARVRAAGLEQTSLGCPVWGYQRGGPAARAVPCRVEPRAGQC